MQTNVRTVDVVVGVFGAALASILAVACGAEERTDPHGEQTSGLSDYAQLRAVDVTVSADKTGETYEARAYPIDDVDGDGRIEYYRAPIYSIYVDGVNAAGKRERREWKAPRFMPYNNPAGEEHDSSYNTVGFVTSGLSSVPRFAVDTYKPDYEVHNRFSPFGGAIVVRGSFYIHAGPENLTEAGWGSAGCVEVIGNFDHFKKDILELAGSPAAEGDAEALSDGIGQLVAARKLFVTYKSAPRPNLSKALSRQVSAEEEHASADQATDPTEPTAL